MKLVITLDPEDFETYQIPQHTTMDKIPQKVTKDPNNQDAARKGREKYMNELKESIITDVKKGGADNSGASNDATNDNNSATTSATVAINKSSVTYISGALI